MSKKLYSAMTAAALLALTACTADDPLAPGSGDGNVVFTVTAPGQLGSRALGDNFGDGGSATRLEYYLYQVDGEGQVSYIGDGSTELKDLKAEVPMKLVTGKTYKVVWLAQHPTAKPYTYDAEETHTISINYDELDLDQNLEERDAFYQVSTVKVEGATREPVQLYRPFAQVNFGTSDMSPEDDLAMNILEKAFGEDLKGLKTQLEVTTEVPTVLNLMTGEVSEESKVTVSFNATGVPEGQDFPYQPKDAAGKPIKTYEYLAMNYLLAPKDGDVMDFEFSVLNDGATEPYNTIKVSSAPVKANYRTNIFGQLLTSTVDFDVKIEPLFVNDTEEGYDPAHDIEVNLNKFFKELLEAEEDGEVEVPGDLDLSDLSGFMAKVNNAHSLKKTRADLVVHIDDLGVLHFSKNLTLTVPAGVTVKTKRHDPTANIIVDEGATLTVKGKGTFDGDNRIIDVNGKLIVDGNLTFKTSTTNRGAALQTNPTGELVFNNGSMYINCIGIWNDGKTTVNDGYFLSYSSSAAGRGGWSYFFNNNYGCEKTGDLTINGGEFRGIQGVVSMCSGKITINDGFFMTTNAHGVGTPFYPVYATNNVVVTINGGYFWGASKFGPAGVEGNSAIVSGDNDTDKPDGKLIINGGYMNGKPYNHVAPALVPAAEGYDYEACEVEKNGVKFTWQVVPVAAEAE